nr:MAG TPA: transmembrane protein [Caudoviricetes sp.]
MTINGNSGSRSSVSFLELLGLLLIGLRLAGSIDWPWWLVLAPLWVPLAATLAVVVVVAIVQAVQEVMRGE